MILGFAHPGLVVPDLEKAMRFYEESTGQSVPRLMMTRAQVRGLADRGFEIGGHTRSHPILKGLPDDEASDEIVG